jgi:hypothetical protein
MVDVKARIEMRNEWVPRPSSAWAGSSTAKDQSRLLKNSFQRSQLPSAAKAATDFAALTARLEAAPFQNAIRNSSSSAAC